MTTIIQQFIAWYRYLNEEVADPRTKDYFLIGSPWPGLTLIRFYFYFIYNLGPRLMEKRQPFTLYRTLQIYNVLQILLNGYLFYKGSFWLAEFNYFCEPIDYSDTPRAREITILAWDYFMIKLIDLIDTIFFVLRKKQDQITFLHLYHHIGILVGAWSAVKWLPGGHIGFLGIINTFVHIIMYTHYLLAAMKIDTSLWKKHITQLQLVQFFLITLHFLQLTWVENCGFPLWPIYVMVPQNLFMIILFGDFYYKAYIKKKPAIKTKMEINSISTELSNGKPKEQ
ncbi:PREDICTED: elongation of very long chain fatty acids protein AAEL008004-like [Trachymyrmex septentrionalis]|uniref:elongation of very long chain fatty acids protein AAEL008004-like n=1 Tax=Trachymyrmex septentrionalis TaxID=34720 RepID=UPI00084F6433|nr:PREDICTED: elongation of very long chain fatty acids protein AAEL008004-like [Trachymyrmex septentrionalis]